MREGEDKRTCGRVERLNENSQIYRKQEVFKTQVLEVKAKGEMELLLHREQEKPAFPAGNPGQDGRCEVQQNIKIKI